MLDDNSKFDDKSNLKIYSSSNIVLLSYSILLYHYSRIPLINNCFKLLGNILKLSNYFLLYGIFYWKLLENFSSNFFFSNSKLKQFEVNENYSDYIIFKIIYKAFTLRYLLLKITKEFDKNLSFIWIDFIIYQEYDIYCIL